MLHHRSPLRHLVTAVAVAVTTGAGLVVGLVVAAPPGAADVASPRWQHDIAGAKFQWSSPAVGDLGGRSGVTVVGGMNGGVYAFGPDGSPMFAPNVGAPVASSPAIGDVDGTGANVIVVGYGAETPGRGGVAIINPDGGIRCRFDTPARSDGLAGVWNSPAIGDVDGDGVNDIVFGSFDNRIFAMHGDCGVFASFDNLDTVWSAPALRDVDGDGAAEIFIGGDATASNVAGSFSGGAFRSLEYDGTGTLAQRWVRQWPETFQGGAAFATIGGQPAVVTGTGADYCRNHGGNCANSQKVWAFDPSDGHDLAGWPRTATYETFLGGPAVGDIDGDGRDDVVISSTDYKGNGAGAVDAFLGNGRHWVFTSADEIPSSPVIADTDGAGTPEVLVGTNGQVYVLDGPTGAVRQSLIAAGNWAHKSAPAVANLAGAWAVVTAGFDPSSNAGKIGAFPIPVPATAPWPQYQKNARRLGSDPTDSGPLRCGSGYWLSASDGGIFAFGPQAPFFGSAGDIHLNQPIVGMAAAPGRAGYWFVATDGGIFTYGNAGFFGSAGNIALNSPIVAMAARPQGDGYWLVAADGGIFSYGNAGFFGSTGNIHLNQPIVGMAATPSGGGYWLVARDGGVFAFGDAVFFGSTGDIHLNQPIVGMAATPAGGGYWFVAADGGVFAFGDAAFFGSTGNIHLNRPVVGMRATPDGGGYWFVATDGGIFAFGDAEFCGSTGNIRLNRPIVGMG